MYRLTILGAPWAVPRILFPTWRATALHATRRDRTYRQSRDAPFIGFAQGAIGPGGRFTECLRNVGREEFDAPLCAIKHRERELIESAPFHQVPFFDGAQ